jgi:DNA polymerase
MGNVMLRPDDLAADVETRSRVNLKAAGARRYAADASTQITTAVWQFRGQLKTACTVFPHLGSHTMVNFYDDIRTCRRFVAHHANFDVNVIKRQNPFLEIPLSKIDCTMARAQALALPGGLNEVCKTLGIPGKDPAGHALVMATCKPQRDGTFREIESEFRDLLAYNVQDVRCLLGVDERLPALSPDERKIFERTWRKNETGLPIDIALATAIALRRQEIEQESTQRLMALTNNAVTKLSQRQRILEWCNSGNRAAGLESTQKHIVAEKLADEELHPDVREVLELLQAEGGSAPLKAQALLDRHVGGYYKDATRYFGARSGRGTSEGANMFNIARPSGKYDVEQVIIGLKQGFRYGNVALTDALRGCIVAPDGWLVCDNDLSNAEYRIALWMAGDTERLNVLASGGDPYIYNAIAMGRCPAGATKHTHPQERQSYKSVTLGGNYQLGWKTYMAHQRRAGNNMDEIKARSDIDGYRQANPLLVQLWYALSDAFKMAIYEQPGRIFPAGKVAFQKDAHGTIWLLLPSGRPVPHYSAHISYDGEMAFFRGKFGAMLRQKAFGGSLLEISCQAMTRDLVTAAEEDIENELPDVYLGLDVYDSILAWAPIAVAKERSEQMRQIMKRPRHWTAGLPLDCEGYENCRMRK